MSDPIAEFLSKKSIAVVGASDRPERYGNRVLRSLIRRGYRVFPVHPTLDVIDGVKVYKTLSDVPEPIEAVDIVVNPAIAEDVVRECHRLGIMLVWLQPGAESPASIQFCETNGITCIHDTCVMMH